ncbi:unnamed protein product [Caenorhabditis brenneri]
MEAEARNANYWLRVPFDIKACYIWMAIAWNKLFPTVSDDYIVEWICVAICFMIANAFYHQFTGQVNYEEEDFEDFFD